MFFLLYYNLIMTKTHVERLPERLSSRNNTYRRILRRQIPGQQAFGIYRGIPTFKAGQVIENLLLISEDQHFASTGACWKTLLREMEKEQGRLRFLREKESLVPTPAAADSYVDPLAKVRSAK